MAPQPPEDGPDITNYWQYFHLHRDPFAMSADKDLYFVPTKWEEILDLLQYISHYKNQLMLVTGDNGAGKSTLAELLVSQIAETMHVGRITAENSFDVSRLIELMSDCFQVPWKPEQPLEQMLDEELTALQQKDRPSLLVIDNAHLLPFETLEALLYLVGQQTEHQMNFHVVLLAEPSLLQTFQRLIEPDEEGLLHSLQLDALNMDETSLYLGHRLAVSGWQEDFPLTDEIITRIYRLSEGNPARINRIARRALLDMLTQDKQDKKPGFLQRYGNKFIGSGVVLIVLILGATWLLRNTPAPAVPEEAGATISLNGQALSAPEKPASVDGTDSQVALPLPPALKTDAATAKPSTDATSSTPDTASAPVTTPSVPATAPVVSTAPAAPAVTTPATTSSTSAPVAAVPQPIMLTAKGVKTAEPVAAKPAPTPAPATNDAAMMNDAAIATETAVKATPANAPEPTVKPATTIEVSDEKMVAAAKDSTAVMKTPVTKSTKTKEAKGAYGLELLGVTSSAQVNELLKHHPELKGKLKVIHVKSGQVKVFYGRYATLNAASQALTKVPSDLADAKLWPNKMPTAKTK